MSRAPRDTSELRELAGDDPRGFADVLEADGRAEGDPTKVEEARIVRRNAREWKASASTTRSSARGDKLPHETSAASDKPKPKGKPATKAKGKPKGKRRGSSWSSTRRAVREATPDRQLAGAIRSTASIGWTIAGGIVLMVLVYLLVTKGSRSVAAVRELELVAKQVVYPKAAFPERNGRAVGPAPPGPNGEPMQRFIRPPGTYGPSDPGGDTIIAVP